jgi:hypothetical protein
MKRNPSEHSIQATLVAELDYKMRREIVRMAIPNGGMRHPIVGKMLKDEGLLPGSPDIVFALERAKTLWLEMKKEKGRLSDVQLGVHHRLKELGHTVEVAYSLDDALEICRHHGLLRSNYR